MNPLAVALAAYVLLGVELGLRAGFELGNTGVAPSLVLPLVVYLAMAAPAGASLWAGLLIGLAVDLVPKTLLGVGAGDVGKLTLIGPNALGFLAAAYLTLLLRGFLIRRNPLSLVALTILGGVLAALIAVALITLRAQFDSALDWSALRQLLARLGWAVYSGLAAFFLAFVFRAVNGALGLPELTGRRYAR